MNKNSVMESGLTELLFALCCLPEESSVHSDSTVEADTNADIMPSLHKQPNLTLELFPNHSENLESAKKVKSGLWCVYLTCVWSICFNLLWDCFVLSL